MFNFICSFLYIGDRSSHSANIPDQVGHMCIISSDCNLKDFPIYRIKDYYVIQELLEQNDCETISLEEITEEDILEEFSGMEQIQINEKDI